MCALHFLYFILIIIPFYSHRTANADELVRCDSYRIRVKSDGMCERWDEVKVAFRIVHTRYGDISCDLYLR